VGLEDKQDAAPAAIYRYDVLSNLRASPAGTSIFNGEGNRLQELQRASAETVPYAYDAAGFATSRDGVPMTWDGAGRLTSYGNASFTWDALGRPVSRVVDGEPVTHRFGGLVEADAAGSPAVIDLGEVKIDLAGSDTRYRHFDYRGNVKLVTDSAGDVVKHYQYSAYAVDAVHGADSDSRTFARGRTVGDLVLIGHRLYDPAAARFLAPDPIDQLINQYAYTLGNPVQFWDPSGAQAVSSNQTAGAMMQGAGNALSMIGAVALGVGVGAVFVPAASVFAVAALVGIGVNFIVLGEGLKSIGGLVLKSEGGSAGGGGGFGAGPGLTAPGSFNDHVGPVPNPGACGGDACAGGAGAPGLAELAALAGLGGPTNPAGAGGGGGGCAPVALGEGRLSNGSLAVLLVANFVTAAIVWRRARIVRSVAKEI
jgi:RHS repeat-associated protein